MREKVVGNDKKTNSVDTQQGSSENQEPKPLWIERLNSYLTDEFRIQLLEIMTKTYWSDVNHGAWNNPMTFFSYLDRQVEIVYQLKDNPLLLRSQFEFINPGLQPYRQGDAASNRRENLSVLRQQVFLINALHIIIKRRFGKDQSLRLALSVLNNLLHQKIIETLKVFGTTMENPEWYYVADRIEMCGDLKSKADAIYDFLSATMKKNNIKSHSDRRNTLLFMKEQLEIPYKVITQNNNAITTAFGGNRKLENLCSNLYYEYHRLITLDSLEGLVQEDSTIETQSQLQESDDLLIEAEQETTNSNFTLRKKVLALMLLTFGNLESPEEVIQERIVEFFYKFTGGDISELRKLVAKPINHKEENNQSIKYLCDDLNYVRNDLEKLGLSKTVKAAINEIDSLITDLEKEKRI